MSPFSLSDDRPSPWEPEVLRDVAPLVRRRAHGIGRLQSIDMEPEDAAQKMYGEVVAVCRRWAEQSPTRPPPALVAGAIRNVTRNLYRTIGRCRRELNTQVIDTYVGLRGSLLRGDERRATIPAYTPPDPRETRDRHRLHVELVARVNEAVTDDQRDLLQLYGADYKPRTIAAALSDGRTDAQVRRSIYKARQRAGDVLRALGIEGTADIERLLETPCDD